MPFPNYSPIAQFKPFKIYRRLDEIRALFSDDCECVTGDPEVTPPDRQRTGLWETTQPSLAGIAGPATQYVLDKIQGK
jgi:hypothetical protein